MILKMKKKKKSLTSRSEPRSKVRFTWVGSVAENIDVMIATIIFM